ncbi:MAG: glutamate--tRNA ligase family protein [Pseudomonadota bacterium]
MAEIFVSYNSNNRDTAIAKSVACFFREYDCSVYFAGDRDNPISIKEEAIVSKAIKAKLSATDIFVVIGTSEYFNGFWSALEFNTALELKAQGGQISILPLWFDPPPADPMLASLNVSFSNENDVANIGPRIVSELKAFSYHQSTRSVRHSQSEPKLQIREERDLFHAYVERHEERLFRRQNRTSDKQFDQLNQSDGRTREPKFMLYEMSEKLSYCLIILDNKSEIDLSRLSSQSDKYRMIRRKADLDLGEMGFCGNEVHPMFRAVSGSVKLIILDANILFQALMFPDSPVIVPDKEPKRKATVSMSSFFRALQDYWSESVEFAHCSSSPWRQDIIWQQITNLPMYTRFAPTPSNSLHIGNLKAALIPYLYALRRDGGSFMLRFDDTDPTRVAEEHYETIRSDLAWFGINIPDEQVRRQSSEQKVYECFLSILNSAHFTEQNGQNTKIIDPPPEHYTFWLDLKKGPIIRRGHSPTQEDGTPLSLDIANLDGSARYKLTGAVDDVLFTSHVFRGRDQLIQGLTDRQVYIGSMIRRALETSDTEKRVELEKMIMDESAKHVEVRRRPLPLHAPLVFTHFGEVLDKDARPYSKRFGAPTVAGMRVKATYLPEAIAAMFVYGMFPGSSSANDTFSTSFSILCRYGIEAFYAHVSSRMDLDFLDRVTSSELISEKSIHKWERRILIHASASALHSFVSRISADRLPIEARQSFARMLRAGDRKELSRWRDVVLLIPLFVVSADVIGRLRQSRNQNWIKDILSSEKRRYILQLGKLDEKNKSELRLRLFGVNEGPRLYSLPGFVGMDNLNRLAERI